MKRPKAAPASPSATTDGTDRLRGRVRGAMFAASYRRALLLGAAAVLLLWTPARAETAAEALTASGLVGTWSPDCNGPIRVSYTVGADGTATSVAVINGTEQAVTELHDIARVAADRIRWTSVYRKDLPLDVPQASWMPEPGETWETILEMKDGKIRSLQSQRADGAKILVRDGFYYVASEPEMPGRPLVWHKTDQPTPFFGRCGAGAIPKAAQSGS